MSIRPWDGAGRPTLLGTTSTCNWCLESILWDGDTWKHASDGVWARQRCRDCPWTGGDLPPDGACPKCGVPRVVTEHYAIQGNEAIRKAVSA